MFAFAMTLCTVSLHVVKSRSVLARGLHGIAPFHAVSPRVFFILGGPGSGKGTQCEMLSNSLCVPHISAGELLRVEMSTNSADGMRISQCLEQGKIVPVSITLGLLRKRIEELQASYYLIDGFPRNEDNYVGWNNCMKNYLINGVFFLDCPEDVLERRLLSRRRDDDSIDSIRKRFTTYRKETLPIVQKYEEQGLLTKINGNRSKEEVFEDMRKHIEVVIESSSLPSRP